MNRSDNNDTLPATRETPTADNHERKEREYVSFIRSRLNAAVRRRFPARQQAPESSLRKLTAKSERRDPSALQPEGAWFAQSHAIADVTGSARPQYVHAFPPLLLPVHAKAGSRWPEPRDGRYAVVSLLSSCAQDLVPA
jgi:hypothetical protein